MALNINYPVNHLILLYLICCDYSYLSKSLNQSILKLLFRHKSMHINFSSAHPVQNYRLTPCLLGWAYIQVISPYLFSIIKVYIMVPCLSPRTRAILALGDRSTCTYSLEANIFLGLEVHHLRHHHLRHHHLLEKKRKRMTTKRKRRKRKNLRKRNINL